MNLRVELGIGRGRGVAVREAGGQGTRGGGW